jgi:HD-like signal output (HDOD) protein
MADPNLNVKKISEFIETDQKIASKVLKIANSAYYGMCGKITSIRHAAIVLGYKIIGEIVIFLRFMEPFACGCIWIKIYCQ